jgi:hypothetical protein
LCFFNATEQITGVFLEDGSFNQKSQIVCGIVWPACELLHDPSMGG